MKRLCLFCVCAGLIWTPFTFAAVIHGGFSKKIDQAVTLSETRLGQTVINGDLRGYNAEWERMTDKEKNRILTLTTEKGENLIHLMAKIPHNEQWASKIMDVARWSYTSRGARITLKMLRHRNWQSLTPIETIEISRNDRTGEALFNLEKLFASQVKWGYGVAGMIGVPVVAFISAISLVLHEDPPLFPSLFPGLALMSAGGLLVSCRMVFQKPDTYQSGDGWKTAKK